ncbi:hypothetical protein AVEN_129263-1 [Araneus ventricosus]|uniref:Uncharacterized protein n=1 Tax=Araneus ventricosus TaxID=182803 RepID=A0A4Y2HMA3_ARAVE|nr:hypothetical protein AVEN_129263-1 [Araneus ventricosus]
MATCQGYFEESPNENSNESTSNLGTVGEQIQTGRGIRATSSSPAILELSKDEFRYQDDGNPTVPLRKHLARSCPQHLSEETPLNSNSESSEHEQSDQGNDGAQMDERRSYCADFFDGLLDSIVQFRNSKLIHVLQILFVPLPMSAVVMGVTYADRCRYLPILSAIIGVVGTIFIGLWIAMTVFQQRGTPCLDNQKFIIGFIFLTLVFLVAIDMSLVGQMSPSFTEGEKNYCHKSFYEYSIKKEILTGAAFVLAAIFYLPRSRHYLCCCSCCSSQPAVPDVQYFSI